MKSQIQLRSIPKPLGLMIVLLSASACYLYSKLNNTAAISAETPMVEVIKIHKKTHVPMVSVYGEAKAIKPYVATTGYPGHIESIAVRPGDVVEPGQAIMVLKVTSTPEWYTYDATRQELEREISKTKEALSTLNAPTKSASPKEKASQDNSSQITNLSDHLAKTETALASLKQEMSVLQAPTNQVLRAKHHGTIDSLLASAGQKVSGIDAVYVQKLANSTFIEATLPDSVTPIIRRALANQVSLKAMIYNAKSSFAAKLTNAYQIDDGRSVLSKAHLSIPTEALTETSQHDGLLLIRLFLPKIPSCYAVPLNAVINSNRVYSVDKDNKLKVHKVKIAGRTTDATGQTNLLIRSKDNLDAQDIIISKQPNLLTGMKVIKTISN